MHEWLEEAAASLAHATGADEDAYRLTEAEIAELLELARAAAHESGERTNAPLICYLVGLVRGQNDGELTQLIAVAARAPTSLPPAS